MTQYKCYGDGSIGISLKASEITLTILENNFDGIIGPHTSQRALIFIKEIIYTWVSFIVVRCRVIHNISPFILEYLCSAISRGDTL